MQLNTEYKQTEFGLVPSDWEVTSLGAIGNFKNGINKPSEDFGHGIPFVNLMDVFRVNSINHTEHLGLVNATNSERNYYDLKEGDVLFIRSSVKPSGVGLTALVKKDLPETVFSGFLIRYRDNGALLTDFKLHCFYAEKFRNNLIANSTVSANTNINQDKLKKLVFIYPKNKSEQNAIANALSDADALIQSLQKLITKKRQIKQGAMQTLLNPYGNGVLKEGWTLKKLGEIADIRSGGTPSTRVEGFWNGNILWCTPTDITALNGSKYINDTARKVSIKGLKNSSAEIIPKNSIVMTSRATIGECAINTFPISTNQGFKNFVPFDSIDVDFLYYLLQTMKQVFIGLCSGSTFLEISKNQVANIEVYLPKEKLEQHVIATILSDMDTEISILESQLAKYQKIKQGMMQNLLTGRIRLV